MYQKLENDYVLRLKDNVYIPMDPDNSDFKEVIAWLNDGNELRPCEPPAVDPKEQAKAELSETDSEIARIAEDLITALISKGVLAEADIPQSARSKMAKRSELRSKLA